MYTNKQISYEAHNHSSLDFPESLAQPLDLVALSESNSAGSGTTYSRSGRKPKHRKLNLLKLNFKNLELLS